MGLTWDGLRFLCNAKRQGIAFDRTVTIGRQNHFILPAKTRQILRDYGITPPLDHHDAIPDPCPYAEPVFQYLGATTVESIDASEYEQATRVCDLNEPIPPELHGAYDVVFDGGTIEHVFNIKQSLKNYMELVKVGGSVFIVTTANNWLGHGFYQLSPELFYRAFSAENGFSIRRVVVNEAYEHGRWFEVPDPALVRSRIEMSNKFIGMHILVHAVRDRVVPIFARAPQQSDYSVCWDGATGPLPAPTPSTGPGRRFVLWFKQKAPWLVSTKHRLNHRYPWLARAIHRRRSLRWHRTHSPESQPEKFRPVRS